MDNQTTDNEPLQPEPAMTVTTARPQVSDAERIRSKVFCILSVLLYVFSILSLCLVYFGVFEFSGLLKSYEGYPRHQGDKKRRLSRIFERAGE